MWGSGSGEHFSDEQQAAEPASRHSTGSPSPSADFALPEQPPPPAPAVPPASAVPPVPMAGQVPSAGPVPYPAPGHPVPTYHQPHGQSPPQYHRAAHTPGPYPPAAHPPAPAPYPYTQAPSPYPYAPARYAQAPPPYPYAPARYAQAPPPYPYAPAPYAPAPYAQAPYAQAPYGPGPVYPPAPGRPGRSDEGLPMPVSVRPVSGTPFMVAIVDVPPTMSGRAVASLVAGVGSILVSFVVGCFGVLGSPDGWGPIVAGAFAVLALFAGVASVVLGRLALRTHRRRVDPERPRGRGIALAGVICGSSGLGLTVLGFLGALSLAALG